MNVIRELEAYRCENKISQEKLAELLDVHFCTVNRWIKGHQKPSRIQKNFIKELIKWGNENITAKKIRKIQHAHEKIWKGYAKSDKSQFAYYWKKMEELEEEYFRIKFEDQG